MPRSPYALALALTVTPVAADEVSILAAELRPHGDGTWQAVVTLRHADTGFEHYADAWRVVGADGAVLGVRTLFHPHVEEQPFTRALSGIAVPAGTGAVHVEAHDNVHGWSSRPFRVELAKEE